MGYRVRQVLRLAHVATMRGAAEAMLRTKPFSSSAFLIARDLRAGCGEFGSVIDVGANVGQFCMAVARVNPSAEVVAIEPVPDVADALRRHVAEDEGARHRVRVLQYAAGSRTGTATMERHEHTVASSMLPATERFDDAFPEDRSRGGRRSIDVDVARLDDVVDVDALQAPVLLKLDVQGYEIEALRGAPRLLERCDYVLAEASFDRLYDGAPAFEDLFDYLRGVGFVVDRPVDFLRGARGAVEEMDVLFRRPRP